MTALLDSRFKPLARLELNVIIQPDQALCPKQAYSIGVSPAFGTPRAVCRGRMFHLSSQQLAPLCLLSTRAAPFQRWLDQRCGAPLLLPDRWLGLRRFWCQSNPRSWGGEGNRRPRAAHSPCTPVGDRVCMYMCTAVCSAANVVIHISQKCGSARNAKSACLAAVPQMFFTFCANGWTDNIGICAAGIVGVSFGMSVEVFMSREAPFWSR